MQLLQPLLLSQLSAIQKSLHRRFAVAETSAMETLGVVEVYPRICILLQLFQVAIEFFAKRHAVKLFEHSAMEAFADAVGLWTLGFGVVNVFHRQIQLVFVVFNIAYLFTAPIRKNPQQRHVLLFKTR